LFATSKEERGEKIGHFDSPIGEIGGNMGLILLDKIYINLDKSTKNLQILATKFF
jgi:hypothetical protein